MKTTIQELLYRSFDDTLNAVEQARLEAALKESEALRKERLALQQLREEMGSTTFQFQPFFANRLMKRVRDLKANNPQAAADELWQALWWSFQRIALPSVCMVLIVLYVQGGFTIPNGELWQQQNVETDLYSADLGWHDYWGD